MYRKAQDHLKNWLNQKKPKPLVIRGARQVGKSTLVHQFAKNQNLKLCEINLEIHHHLDKVFASLDINRILKEIESLSGGMVIDTDTLIFLDEIQATPHALTALRYFYENRPDLKVIVTGSLLEFVLKDHSFSMPVGRVEYLFLGPMTFEEYLMAQNEDHLLSAIKNYQVGDPFTESDHRQLLTRQREFLLIGGMPEVMQDYVDHNSLTSVQRIQESIILTYTDDFSKYMRNKSDLARLQNAFKKIPNLVGKKIKYVSISRNEKSREVKAVLDLLNGARVTTPVYHSDCSGLPLEAMRDDHVFKMLFLDVGLMNKTLGLSWSSLESLDDRSLVNEGSMAEQFIGQHLLFLRPYYEEPKLHYWLREGKTNNAEIDYVVSIDTKILPIEIKAGHAGQMKSLQQFMQLKKSPCALRFDLNAPGIQKVTFQNRGQTRSFDLLNLPLYFVSEWERLARANIQAAKKH